MTVGRNSRGPIPLLRGLLPHGQGARHDERRGILPIEYSRCRVRGDREGGLIDGIPVSESLRCHPGGAFLRFGEPGLMRVHKLLEEASIEVCVVLLVE